MEIGPGGGAGRRETTFLLKSKIAATLSRSAAIEGVVV
jgi:hypothetical protein